MHLFAICIFEGICSYFPIFRSVYVSDNMRKLNITQGNFPTLNATCWLCLILELLSLSILLFAQVYIVFGDAN